MAEHSVKKNKKTMDVRALCYTYDWTEKKVRAHIARRQIPFRKLGGRVIFFSDEIEEYLKALPGCRLEEALERLQQSKGN